MASVTSWDAGIARLAASPPGTAVSVCYDTRTNLSYAPALGSLRAAWANSWQPSRASNIRAHVHLELIGAESAPAVLGDWCHWWAKVWLGKELLKLSNVGWVLWLDADAAPVPIIRHSDLRRRRRDERLEFPALEDVVKEALAAAQPPAADQPHAAALPPAADQPQAAAQPPAVDQPPAAAQPPAADQPPGFDDLVFLGYREKAKTPNWVQCMNAGVWIVHKSERSSLLMERWWSRRRDSSWKPAGRIGDCEGCEQTEFELMLGCRQRGNPPAARQTMKKRPATGGEGPLTKRPATGGKGPLAKRPATGGVQPQAACKNVAASFPAANVGGGVFLVPEQQFCDQGAGKVGATPFVHFYGNSQWIGKAKICHWLRRLMAAIPAKHRKMFPGVQRRLLDQARLGNRPEDQRQCKARGRNIKAIRKSLGKQVRYQGKLYPSIRAAHEQTGACRQILRACVI